MKIQIPKNCPCCGYALELINDQLFCKNSSCSAQLNKKLEHFTKTLGIKGFGPRTVEKLQVADIIEIFYLEEDTLIKALGSEKVAHKLLEEIEKAKSASMDTVIAAFSIPLIGNTAALKLSNVISSLDEITLEKCKEAGLGDKATSNILEWFNTEYKELREFLPFSFDSTKKFASNMETICITGKLSSFKTKNEAAKVLEDLGYRVVDSVTKSLDYLVDESNKDSSKRKKAEEYGVKIITNLNNFLEDIK